MSAAERKHRAAREAVAGADRALREALVDVERCRSALRRALRAENEAWAVLDAERRAGE